MKKKYIVIVAAAAIYAAGSVATGATKPFEKNLVFGTSKSAEVRRLQEFLKQQNLFSGSPTGNYLVGTLNAVRALQRTHGIKPTGNFGPATRAKANELLAALEGPGDARASARTEPASSPAAASSPANADLLASLTAQIANLQAQLNAAGSEPSATPTATPSPQPPASGLVVTVDLTTIPLSGFDKATFQLSFLKNGIKQDLSAYTIDIKTADTKQDRASMRAGGNTMKFEYMPYTGGTHPVTFTLSGDSGVSATQSFSLTVIPYVAKLPILAYAGSPPALIAKDGTVALLNVTNLDEDVRISGYASYQIIPSADSSTNTTVPLTAHLASSNETNTISKTEGGAIAIRAPLPLALVGKFKIKISDLPLFGVNSGKRRPIGNLPITTDEIEIK